MAPLNGAIFEHYGNDGSVDSIAPPATPSDNTNWLFKAFALFNGSAQNPFASIEEYLAATQITWKVSTTVALSTNLLTGNSTLPGIGTTGQIVTPPGPIPAIPVGNSNFNWLDMGYSGTQRGSAFTTSHEYKLSGPRGWNPTVYQATTT
jgi:hypothetical protein